MITRYNITPTESDDPDETLIPTRPRWSSTIDGFLILLALASVILLSLATIGALTILSWIKGAL